MHSYLVNPLSAALLAVCVSLSLGAASSDGWQEKRNSDGKVVQQMQISAPTMTEEDQYGYNMPDKYRCDSCKAVMFHLNAAMKKRHPKSRRMSEWEYNDLFEETCNEAFEGYGIKLVNGENALSGPGLAQPDIAPGAAMIQYGGDGWKNRLREICRKLVFEQIGEDELYERYRSDGKIPESMCWKETSQCRKTVKPQKLKAEKVPPKKQQVTSEKHHVQSKQKVVPNGGPKAKAPVMKQVEVNSKAIASPSGSTKVNKTGMDGQMDMETYMRSLALEDGLTTDTYAKLRPKEDWDSLIVAMASKIYMRHSE